MKKLSLCLIGLSLLLPLLAQQGMVTMTFADCFTTYGEENLQVVFPYTYHGHEYTEPVSGVKQTITNVRNCDSVVTLTLTEKPAPVGAINGNAVFSVSATKKVYFSKGNLQYQPNTNTFRFAEHQYEYIGNSASFSTGTSWYDLFVYGSSGAYYSSQSKYIYPYGSYYDSELPAQNISGTDFDWGIYNPISNGGNQKGQWRSITRAEVEYLYNSHQKTLAMITDVDRYNYYGFIIFPDNWTWPTGVEQFTFKTSVDKWTNNYMPTVPILSVATWEALENSGAVFFPAGKNEVTLPNNTPYGNFSGSGYYWTGSYDKYASNEYAHGYIIGSPQTTVCFSYDNSSYMIFVLNKKYNVRLVQEQTNE